MQSSVSASVEDLTSIESSLESYFVRDMPLEEKRTYFEIRKLRSFRSKFRFQYWENRAREYAGVPLPIHPIEMIQYSRLRSSYSVSTSASTVDDGSFTELSVTDSVPESFKQDPRLEQYVTSPKKSKYLLNEELLKREKEEEVKRLKKIQKNLRRQHIKAGLCDGGSAKVLAWEQMRPREPPSGLVVEVESKKFRRRRRGKAKSSLEPITSGLGVILEDAEDSSAEMDAEMEIQREESL